MSLMLNLSSVCPQSTLLLPCLAPGEACPPQSPCMSQDSPLSKSETSPWGTLGDPARTHPDYISPDNRSCQGPDGAPAPGSLSSRETEQLSPHLYPETLVSISSAKMPSSWVRPPDAAAPRAEPGASSPRAAVLCPHRPGQDAQSPWNVLSCWDHELV